MEISVISNHFVEKYFNDALRQLFGQENESVNITNISKEVFAQEDYQENYKASEFIVIWLDLEFLFPKGKNVYALSNSEVNAIWNLLVQINNHCMENGQAQVIWISFDKNRDDWRYCGCLLSEINPVDELNYRMMKQFKNAVIIDLGQVITAEGMEAAYSLRHADLWNVKYGKKILRRVAYEVFKQYKVLYGRPLKCIVTDCDNVIWKGILSEDGMDHLVCEGIHELYQKELLKLYQRGIILCIASKNDEDDIAKALKANGNMILNQSHFACVEANWGDKAESIQRISDALNIGLDSILFVDDSVFEIENVKQGLPELSACLFDQDILSKLSVFHLKLFVDEDNAKLRQMTYKSNVRRREERDRALSYEDYLKALESKVLIERATEEDIDRISELTQRTNKLTNGMRFTVQDFVKKQKKDHVYKVSLSDRFGDFGLVGAMSVSRNDGKNCLDLYCLSCRALGRNIEKQMVEFIQENDPVENFFYASTGKNDKVKTILGEIGKIVWQGNDMGGQNSCLSL